jgi:hypothetical protein
MNELEHTPGQILLFSRNTPVLGDLIRHAQSHWLPPEHAQWTHAMVDCWTSAPELIVAEDLQGVRRVGLGHYVQDPLVQVIAAYDAPGVHITSMLQKAQALNSEAYATADLVRVYLARVLGWKAIDLSLLDSEDRVICSEFAARCLYAGGIDVRGGYRSFGLVTPGDLAANVRLHQAAIWHRP